MNVLLALGLGLTLALTGCFAKIHQLPAHLDKNSPVFAPLADQEVLVTVPASFDEAARELTLQAASPSGNGELWSASARLWEQRPRLAFAVAIPGALHRSGIWTVAASWQRQAFRLPVAAPGALAVLEQRHVGLDAAEREHGAMRENSTASSATNP